MSIQDAGSTKTASRPWSSLGQFQPSQVTQLSPNQVEQNSKLPPPFYHTQMLLESLLEVLGWCPWLTLNQQVWHASTSSERPCLVNQAQLAQLAPLPWWHSAGSSNDISYTQHWQKESGRLWQHSWPHGRIMQVSIHILSIYFFLLRHEQKKEHPLIIESNS